MAESHAVAQNGRISLRKWRDYIVRLFTMRKKVAQFTIVTRMLGMAPYLQEWAAYCKTVDAQRSALVWTQTLNRPRGLREVFVQWRKRTGDLAQRAAAVRAIQKMLHVNAYERYLQHWATWTRWKKWCTTNVDTGQQIVSRSLQRKTFSQWCKWRTEVVTLRVNLNAVVKRWALMECSTALRHWANLCKRKRRMLMIMAKHLVSATNFYFGFWVTWTVRMKKV
jgi:hypothetical protein